VESREEVASKDSEEGDVLFSMNSINGGRAWSAWKSTAVTNKVQKISNLVI